MREILWLIAVELGLLGGACTLWWLVGGWRQRRRQAAELEALLTTLQNAESERSRHYCEWITVHCGVDEERALIGANAWLEAEKRFWRHVVAWRLGEDTTLPQLPAHLHRCLDDHLETLAPLLTPAETTPAPEETDAETETPPEPIATPPTDDSTAAEEDASPPETPEAGETGDNEGEEKEDGILVMEDDDPPQSPQPPR